MDDKIEKSKQDHPDGNEITPRGKLIAGILLIIFTALPSYIIIAYWPDRLPGPKEDIRPLYINERFHVRLACVKDTLCCTDTLSIKSSFVDTLNKTITDTAKIKTADTTSKKPKDSTTNQDKQKTTFVLKQRYYFNSDLVHINTLLLALIAAAGFLGNMVYVATSFTNFIGAGQFRRTWILWYCVKPFTASALAIGLYFVFRGGFLNMSDDSTNINLYGIMTVSLLTGLFTDRATQKLKEIFEVLFNPKNERPNPLTPQATKITGVQPMEIERGKPVTIVISGENLNNKKITVSINDTLITNAVTTASTITFTYTLPDNLKDATECKLSVKDDKGVDICPPFTLKIKSVATATDDTPPSVNDTNTDNSEDETDEKNPFVKG